MRRSGHNRARQSSNLILIALIATLVACDRKPSPPATSPTPDANAAIDPIRQGRATLKTYCTTCHGVANRSMEAILAPPLFAVRAHYIEAYPEPEAFADAVAAFLMQPDRTKSRMPKANERHGLKSPVNLPEAELRNAARAIHAQAYQIPDWAYQYRKAHKDCDVAW